MTAILLGSVNTYAGTTVLNTFYASVWAGGGGGGGSGDEHPFGSRKKGGSGARGATGAFGEIKIEGLNTNHRLKFVVGAGGSAGVGGNGGTGGTGGGLSSVVLSDVDGTKNETLIAMGGGGGGGGGQDGGSVSAGLAGQMGQAALAATTTATASAGGTGGDDGGSAGSGGASFAVTAVLDGTYNSTVHSGVVVTLLSNEAGGSGQVGYNDPRGDTNHFSVTNANVGIAGKGGSNSDANNGNPGYAGKIVYGFSSANTTTQTTELLVDPTTLTGAE